MDEQAAPARLSRPRGSYAKSTTTRAAILDAALDVFARGGFRAGSLREVAAQVGMSEAGLLHHFGSKTALLEAVLDRRDRLAEKFVPAPSGDARDSVRGLIELARSNASEPGVVALYCTLSAEATEPSHPAHEYFVRRYAATRGVLVEAFNVLQQEGLLRDGVTPETAARKTVAIMDGLQVQWLLDPPSLDMAEELCEFLRLLTTLEL